MSAQLSTGPANSDRFVWPSEDGYVSDLLTDWQLQRKGEKTGKIVTV